MIDDPSQLTIADAARLIEARRLSPVDLVEALLERIAAVEPPLRSFITVTAEQARAEARVAEQSIAQGGYRGPLHGIPLAHKDVFETAGVRTTAGSSFLADWVPASDAAAVARLRAAGAILLGKLNLHEWAMSITSDNPHFGTCRNPWNPDHIPGGSSGGSGAALAAGLCLGSLGTDTGGSVRLPAALCGVVGLKPTFGRVSRRGVVALSPSLDTVGPMARSVRDVDLLLQAIAGHDAADPYSANVPTEDGLGELEAGVRGWRVGVALRDFLAPDETADDEQLQAVERAARALEQAGARVREATVEGAWAAQRATFTLIVSEAAALHRERLATNPDGFGADVLAALRRGERTTPEAVAQARAVQAAFRQHLEALWGEFDLLLTPASPVPAPRHDETAEQRRARPSLLSWLAPFNLAGVPALSVPCGFGAAGLPIGVQLVGRAWAEGAVLRGGRVVEQRISG